MYSMRQWLSHYFTISSTAIGQVNSSKVSNGQVKQFISIWSATSKEVANMMIKKYGNPQEATANMLIWYNNGPWKRTILFKKELPHNFPMAFIKDVKDLYTQVL